MEFVNNWRSWLRHIKESYPHAFDEIGYKVTCNSRSIRFHKFNRTYTTYNSFDAWDFLWNNDNVRTKWEREVLASKQVPVAVVKRARRAGRPAVQWSDPVYEYGED